jgi:class 3 adenylate cyclase
MLKVVMDAMPRADAATIVRIPADTPSGEQRLLLLESNVRPKTSHGPNGFVPSRRLAHRAIVERRRSCLHCWSPDQSGTAGSELTMADTHVHGVTPWAVCTPFQDGSRYALYFAGQTAGQWNLLDKPAQDKIVNDLTQYQKIAELLVGMIETTLRVSRLTQQNKVIRRAWPQSLWKYLDDPEELERMLAPKEQEITTLFCDLRNYSLFASQNAAQLLQAQKEVSTALSTMSGAITDRDGVVAGFRGDAVLGFWGWPKLHDKQVEMAARAAITIQGRLNSWSQAGRCGLGLTHGVAVAGRLGAHDLAVVDLYGPVVNLTFRLEAMTKAFGVPIIISKEIADRIAICDPEGREMLTRPLGKVRAKGFPDPLWAYELFSAHTPSVNDYQLAEWAAAVDLFTTGNWPDAHDTLTAQFSADPAAHCLMRVMDRHKRRAPSDWDGSFAPPSPEGG